MSSKPAAKIRVTSKESLPPDQFNHRRWLVDIIWTTPDGIRGEQSQFDVEITDPFTIGEYHEYEQQQQPVSISKRLQPSQDSGLTDTSSTNAGISDDGQSMLRCGQPSSRLGGYRLQLQLLLQLDELIQRVSLIEIYIIEDLKMECQDHESCYSVHSLLWELLEQNQNVDIQVTRWITGADSPGRLPTGLGASDKPIRILLVIARDLKVKRGQHIDPNSVAYDTLYAIVNYLGRNGRLSVDIVRPGTFSELINHLKCRAHYDLVHIDVHGDVKRLDDTTSDYAPELSFGHYNPTSDSTADSETDSETDAASLDKRSTEEVATLLTNHGITVVVLSACLSSFGQGRLLSNMCRVFARHGTFAVTGMNFSVKAATAQIYYDGFYEALLLENQSFRDAAVHGRRMVRSKQLEQQMKKKRRSKREQASIKVGSRAPTTTSLPDGTTEGWNTHSKHDEWPMATTYFAVRALGKKNTFDIMGEHCRQAATATINSQRLPWLSIVLIETVAIFGYLWGVLGGQILLYTNMVILFWFAIGICSKPASHNPKAFQSSREKMQLKHSVGLMVLEDKLKSAGRIFVQVPLKPKRKKDQRQYTRELQNQWLLTNFADSVEVVPASTFKWLLRFKCRWAWYCVSCWFAGLQLPWKRRGSIPGPRSVLIITEIDSIIDKDMPIYASAFDYMGSFIRTVEERSPGGSYLMITSHGGVRWPEMTLFRKRHPWIGAESFSAALGFTVVEVSVQ